MGISKIHPQECVQTLFAFPSLLISFLFFMRQEEGKKTLPQEILQLVRFLTMDASFAIRLASQKSVCVKSIPMGIS